MNMLAKALAEKLNQSLPESLFEELTNFLEEGDVSSLYEEMAEMDAIKHPDKYCHIPYEVEYDLNYTGGNYSSVGRFVTVSSPAMGLVPKLFKQQTGIDPIHIIHYEASDELPEKD